MKYRPGIIRRKVLDLYFYVLYGLIWRAIGVVQKSSIPSISYHKVGGLSEANLNRSRSA